MAKNFVRVAVIADLHCGHKIGLTHPDFNPVYKKRDGDGRNFYLSQKRSRLWKFYAEALTEFQPIDVAIINGDAVDGKGEKSGSTELITADRNEQANMAVAAIETIKAKEMYMSFGTPYHAGASEDFEEEVANGIHAVKVGGHDWLDVNGVVFDYRHFASRSIIPHGRFTPLARERLWSVLWAEHGEYPAGDILLRSHTHYYGYCGGYGWAAYSTPALQGAGTKYGTRIMSGTVDFGLLVFDVYGKGDWKCHTRILKLKDAHFHTMKALQKT